MSKHSQQQLMQSKNSLHYEHCVRAGYICVESRARRSVLRSWPACWRQTDVGKFSFCCLLVKLCSLALNRQRLKKFTVDSHHCLDIVRWRVQNFATVTGAQPRFQSWGVQFLGLGYYTEQNMDGIPNFVHCSVLRNGNHTLCQESWGGPSKFWGSGPP